MARLFFYSSCGVCSCQFESKVVNGKNSGKQITRSLAIKAHGRMQVGTKDARRERRSLRAGPLCLTGV